MWFLDSERSLLFRPCRFSGCTYRKSKKNIFLLCDYGGPFHRRLQFFFVVSTLLFNLCFQFIHVVKHCVLSYNFEAYINVEENTSLLHYESRVESWPHFDLVGIQTVSFGRVEGLPADGLEPESSHE